MNTEFTWVFVVTDRLAAIPVTLADDIVIWNSNGERLPLLSAGIVAISKP